ncbi:site-specific DNA-methyltransferase [Candidatus Nomurabacteria bacterium]|nr:site-specific DNA-methyltransferase [Candidatus Nomurabacteria bacterium]
MKNYKNMNKEELLELVEQLQSRKKYGLVWEDKPEDVVEKCKEHLPVLEEVAERTLEKDENGVTNLLIEGDNYHALSVLNYTHAGKVDVIYIDPPYNTGNNSWRYNNDYVDSDDPYRHSKWLSMMAKRIEASKNLLKEDGVLFLTIDDYEIFQIGLLLDEIFGEENRMGIVAIEINPRGRTTNKNFATSHEYILMYGRSSKSKVFDLPLTDEQKKNFGLEDETSNYRLLPFRRSGGLSVPKDRPNSEFFIAFEPKHKKIVGVGGSRIGSYKDQYKTDTVFVYGKKGSIEECSIEDFRKSYPNINMIMPIDSNGKRRVWRWSDREKILRNAAEGEFVVKKVKGSYSVYLKDRTKSGRKPKTIWVDSLYDASSHGTNMLKNLFGGEKVFDYPKSLYAVIDTLKVSKAQKNKKVTILDFFAGSGTTAHAVLELNKQDGGNRQFILCTNNENGIAEEVTYPRVENVIEGYADVEGIPANLRYFKTTFVKQSEVSDDTRRELVKKSTEMICVKEGTYKKIYDNKKYKVYKNNDHLTGILFDLDSVKEFKEKVDAKDMPAHLYIFSLSHDTFEDDFADLSVDHTLCPIPESILEVYRKLFA